ncbi:hypothetical protein [uncultured Halomonas sp.]|uniref:hypothetical protein n=1 Tax=uncultured Halomonas sp. TaxID=173971 RepID=UPI00260A66CA|nr:hypothetical protein [uncultured Halomonas sp.]
MSRYLNDDRRYKAEGEHLARGVRVRFTEDEYDELRAAAEMRTEGRLAPYLRDLVLEAHEARKEGRARLLARLAEDQPLDDRDRQVLAGMLARLAERGLMMSADTAETLQA